MTDVPLLLCAAQADQAMQRGATIFQKWTCQHCRTRQTMETPDVFYKSGICEECDSVTEIRECGFAAVFGR